MGAGAVSHTEKPGSKVTLVLPYPPPGNALWRIFKPKKGPPRMIESDVARAYKRAVRLLLTESAGALRWTAPLLFEVDAFRPRRIGDADAPLKVLKDSLQTTVEKLRKGATQEHPGLYENDSQTVEIRLRRYDDKAYPRVQVTVTVVDTPSGPPPERWPEPPGWAQALAELEAALEKTRERARGKRERKAEGTPKPPPVAVPTETYGQRMLREMPQAARPQRRRGAVLRDLATSATYPPRKP